MLDTESVSRAFVRFTGSKLLGILHKAENDIYERLGEITLEDDPHRALELAEDVDCLVMGINVHLGFAGRTSSSLRGAAVDHALSVSTHLSPYLISELMSILASLYSVLLDITIGFSRNEAECTNKLRQLVNRMLTTFPPTYSMPRYSSESSSKPLLCADIRLLDVIVQTERITSLRSSAILLPLFDSALLAVKRALSTSQHSNKKNTQSSHEARDTDSTFCNESAVVMLKAIVVVRIAKRIFSRHALRHLRALHASNGTAFPHVGIPLLTTINDSPYRAELPESAHTSAEELRSFLLDYTACTDELMERLLLYLTQPALSPTPADEDFYQDSSAENDCMSEKSIELSLAHREDSDLPEKRRKMTSRSGAMGDSDTTLFSLDRLRNGGGVERTSERQSTILHYSSRREGTADDGIRNITAARASAAVAESDSVSRSDSVEEENDDSDCSNKNDVVDDNDDGDVDMNDCERDDDGDDDDIPLDQLRHRRPKSVDSTLSASWASCSLEQSSENGLGESAVPSPLSTTNSTANGTSSGGSGIVSNSGFAVTMTATTINTTADSGEANGRSASVRRSARLSSKSRTVGINSSQ